MNPESLLPSNTTLIAQMMRERRRIQLWSNFKNVALNLIHYVNTRRVIALASLVLGLCIGLACGFMTYKNTSTQARASPEGGQITTEPLTLKLKLTYQLTERK